MSTIGRTQIDTKRVVVVGQGYVGLPLPLAMAAVAAGFATKVAEFDDHTTGGVVRCAIMRGTTTDLIAWAAYTDVAWERRST